MTAHAVAQSEDGAVSSKAINTWVKQLNSNRFEVRETASRLLVEAGTPSIAPLTEAIKTGSIETRIRGLDILRELALQDESKAIGAEQAIQELATLQGTIAQRAQTIQDSLRDIRTTRAVKILRRLGATLSSQSADYDEQRILGNRVLHLTLDKAWRGDVSDLDFISWLADYDGVKVLLRGADFDDEWFAKLITLDNLVSFELNRTSITDRGLASVRGVSKLRVAQIRYCPNLTDACLQHFGSLSDSLMMFKVFDAQITKQSFDRLAKKNPGWETRYGRGGFLGIGGTAHPNGGRGCLVTKVTANQAASIAGIREYDIITAYNGQRVDHFIAQGELDVDVDEEKPRTPSLSELIAKNVPGDKVKVTLMRGENEIVKEVVLGEWP